jgi:hypothetical protein
MTRSPSEEVEGAKHVARALGLTYVDLDESPPSPGILRKLPLEVARSARCVPVVYNRRRIVLCVDDPARTAWIEAHREDFGLPHDRRLEFALTTPSALDRVLCRRSELSG